MLNAEEKAAASRTFAHEPGEGEAWWWFGVLATIKVTGEQTGALFGAEVAPAVRKKLARRSAGSAEGPAAV